MRLVLHPKVHSDVHTIMEYYERVAGPELADDFYSELRHFMVEAAERPDRIPSARPIFAAPTCIAFLIIFSFLLSAIRCGFWLSDITGGVRRWVCDADETSPNQARLASLRALSFP